MRHLNRPIANCDSRYLHERCLVAPTGSSTAKVELLSQDLPFPNGIGFSPDVVDHYWVRRLTIASARSLISS